MQIKDIFQKPVERTIEGVIKVDDLTNLKREVEEFVITSELKSKLSNFFDAYLAEELSPGVWISGFFGSGKSHLLKMLSLLLENWKEGDFSILDNFVEKCGEDEILIANMKKAAKISSDSILFNIDQKADVISGDNSERLLAVFVKVFDEYCGYYGKQGYIAQFERDLDKRGIFNAFKDKYASLSGISWEVGREQAVLESLNISGAYAQVAGKNLQEIPDILDKYKKDYKVSIEDFAKQVQEYISSKEEGFRLNFFVDEAGQFIANDSKLMLNLQTIAENFTTICQGNAWLIVTSQEDLKIIVGDKFKETSNDFSKILGRFRTQINLTSANVDEVIQKRLLAKNESAIDFITELYYNYKERFRTMFEFVDGAQTYRLFKDADDFIYNYPFLPYQFSLFQKVMQELSKNNAFSGKYRAVGERSMLQVFQQVVKSLLSAETGTIATFDLMFEGIRSIVNSQIQAGIINAENNLPDEFAVRILKALFMLKYVKDFKATVNNVSILMIDKLDRELIEHRAKVKEALTKLENQLYIQRSGEEYEYLTNEEKDVEQEIKNTLIDDTEMLEKLDEILFKSAQIVKTPKIRYLENKQNFSFTRWIDNKQFAKDQELAIKIITPLNERYDFEDDRQIMSHSLALPELTILLPPDKLFWNELKIALQTDKCYNVNHNTNQRESILTILRNKRDYNKERWNKLTQYLNDLVCKAKFYVCGERIISEQDTNGNDANAKINNAFQLLINKVYPQLKMLHSISYAEQDIGLVLENSQKVMDFDNSLNEAEQEVFSYLALQEQAGKRCTVKDIMEHFNKKPYGWDFYAILYQLVNLWIKTRIEILENGASLENTALEKALKNSQKHSMLIIQKLEDIEPGKIRRLKYLYQNLFDKPIDDTDAKGVVKEFTAKLSEYIQELDKFIHQCDKYPFTQKLKPYWEKLNNALGKNYNWYYNELLNYEEELIKDKQELVVPIWDFMHSPQREIYDSIDKFIKKQEPNFSYLEPEKVNELINGFQDPEIYIGNRLQQLKTNYEILSDKLARVIKKEIENASNAMSKHYTELKNNPLYQKCSEEKKNKIETFFHNALNQIQAQSIIGVIKDNLHRCEEEYIKLLQELKATAEIQAESEIKNIEIKIITESLEPKVLNNIQEVEEFISQLRNALHNEILKGNKIVIK